MEEKRDNGDISPQIVQRVGEREKPAELHLSVVSLLIREENGKELRRLVASPAQSERQQPKDNNKSSVLSFSSLSLLSLFLSETNRGGK